MSLLLCIIVWVIVVLNWFYIRDILYPAFLQSLLWALILSYFYISRNNFYEVSNYTMFLLSMGVVFFSIGCFIANFKNKPVMNKNLIKLTGVPSKTNYRLLILISLLPIPFILYSLLHINMAYSMGSFYQNLNVANREGVLSSYATFMWIANTALAISIFQFLNKKSNGNIIKREDFFYLGLSILICFFYAFIFTGRNFIISLVLIALGILLIQRVLNPIKNISIN